MPPAGGPDELVTTLQGLVGVLEQLVTTLSQRGATAAAPAAIAGANGGAEALAADGAPSATVTAGGPEQAASGCCGGGAGCGSGHEAAGGAALLGTEAAGANGGGATTQVATQSIAQAAPEAGAAAAPKAKSTAKAGTAAANAQIVAEYARKYGVDPVLAVAMMLKESGGRSRAVGDNGTSFGLFQLHKGGMLTSAGLTPEQAFDPATNANVAMKALKHFAKKTGLSGGALAAASQRPADPQGYARRVDAAMDQARKLLAQG